MPFTPFHWGIPLFISDMLFDKSRNIHVRTSMISIFLVSFPDVEGFLHLIIGIDAIQLHGPLHSYFSALVGGVIGILIVTLLQKINRLPGETPVSRAELFFYLCTPLLLHIIPDLMLYTDMEPWWPFSLKQNTIPTDNTDWFTRTALRGTTFLFPVYLVMKQLYKSIKYSSTQS